MGFKLDPPYCG